jgi:hypothetical protein
MTKCLDRVRDGFNIAFQDHFGCIIQLLFEPASTSNSKGNPDEPPAKPKPN